MCTTAQPACGAALDPYSSYWQASTLVDALVVGHVTDVQVLLPCVQVLRPVLPTAPPSAATASSLTWTTAGTTWALQPQLQEPPPRAAPTAAARASTAAGITRPRRRLTMYTQACACTQRSQSSPVSAGSAGMAGWLLWARHAVPVCVGMQCMLPWCWASGGLDMLQGPRWRGQCIAHAANVGALGLRAGIGVKRGGCAMQSVRTAPAPLTALPLTDH